MLAGILIHIFKFWLREKFLNVLILILLIVALVELL